MRGLRSTRAPWLVVGLALLVALPSIAIGFYTDDYTLFAYLTKVFPESPPWYNLYGFIPGDLETNRVFLKQGFIAWWSAPDLRVQLLRPLTSALFTIERALFGNHALYYHLHSLAWFAGLLAALWALYRRLFTRELATLSLLVFGLSSANLHLYGWVSARHMLLSVTFVVLSLLFQERALDAREPKSARAWSGLSWLMLGLALLAGESGLCGLIFGATRAFFLACDPDLHSRTRGHASTGGRPIRAALPYLATAAAYLALYAALGGGARSSGMYLSPLSSPLAYAKAALVRVPALLGNALLSVPADLINVVPPRNIVLLGLVATALFAWLVSRVWSSLSPAEQSTLGWLSVAALVSLPAMVGGSPGSRMLAMPNIGFAPLCAAVLLYATRAFSDAGRAAAIAGRGLVLLFAASALFLGPLQLFVGVAMHRSMVDKTMFVARNLPASALRTDTRLVMLASSDPLAYIYPRSILAAEGRAQPWCWSVLSGAHADHRVTRTGARELTLTPIGRTFLAGEFEGLFRASSVPFRVGDQVTQCGLSIRVLAMQSGRPSTILVTFDTALDDPSLTLVEWQEDRFVSFVPPALGRTVTWRWTAGPTGLF